MRRSWGLCVCWLEQPTRSSDAFLSWLLGLDQRGGGACRILSTRRKTAARSSDQQKRDGGGPRPCARSWNLRATAWEPAPGRDAAAVGARASQPLLDGRCFER